MIIGVSGTHGVGKTTFVYKLAHQLKMDHPEKLVEIIPEVAKKSPFPIFSEKTKSTIESQLWMFCEQFKLEIEYNQKFKDHIVITDRTIYDYISYTMVLDKKIATTMMELILPIQYDKIYFLRSKGEKPITQNSFRSLDQNLQNQIDKNLKNLLMTIEGEETVIEYLI